MRHLFAVESNGDITDIEVNPRSDMVVIDLHEKGQNLEELVLTLEEAGEFESYFSACVRQAESNFEEMEKKKDE